MLIVYKEYTGALQYQAPSSKHNTNKAPQGKKASRCINCVLQFDVKLSKFLKDYLKPSCRTVE